MITWDPWAHWQEWYPDVQVVTMKLPDGLRGCIDVQRRIIWLDETLTPAERRSTLSYELGYLELGPIDLDGGGGEMVYDWASRLLVPFDDLLRACRRYDDLDDVAEQLSVDVPMLKARLRGLTDEEQALVGVDRWHIS